MCSSKTPDVANHVPFRPLATPGPEKKMTRGREGVLPEELQYRTLQE